MISIGKTLPPFVRQNEEKSRPSASTKVNLPGFLFLGSGDSFAMQHATQRIAKPDIRFGNLTASERQAYDDLIDEKSLELAEALRNPNTNYQTLAALSGDIPVLQYKIEYSINRGTPLTDTQMNDCSRLRAESISDALNDFYYQHGNMPIGTPR